MAQRYSHAGSCIDSPGRCVHARFEFYQFQHMELRHSTDHCPIGSPSRKCRRYPRVGDNHRRAICTNEISWYAHHMSLPVVTQNWTICVRRSRSDLLAFNDAKSTIRALRTGAATLSGRSAGDGPTPTVQVHMRMTACPWSHRTRAIRHEREHCIYGLGLRCNEIIDCVRCATKGRGHVCRGTTPVSTRHRPSR
jgi:hypothetical protein